MPRFLSSRALVWPAWLLIAGLTLALFLPGLGDLPLIDRDEGEYATVAWEMVQRGDYVIPHVNGRQYYEKPALFFWLEVISFKIFGWNEFGARFPSALCGLALVALTGWFARKQGDDLLGILAALFTATSFLVVLLARTALLDMLLTLWTTATLFFYFQGYRSPPGRGRWWFRAAWAAMGLAFLTKGPVGAVVPLGAVFFVTVFNRNLWASIRRSEFPVGLLIFLAVSGPWYLAAFLREGENFWRGFFISQNVTRFTEVLLGHGAPVWFYLPVLALFLWPWFFFAWPVMWRAVRDSNWAQRESLDEPALDFFLTVWFLTTLAVFSAAATKQPNYILPAAPPLLILAARRIREILLKERNQTRLERAADPGPNPWPARLTGLTGLLLAAIPAIAPLAAPMALERAREQINPDSFEYALTAHPPDLGPAWVGLGILIALTALGGLHLARRRRKDLAAFAVWALGGLILSLGLTHVLAPQAMDYLQRPARDLAREVREMMGPEDSLASYGLYKPTLWFYTGRHIKRIKVGRTELLDQTLAAESRIFFLSRKSLAGDLTAKPRFRLLKTSGGYILGDNQGGDP